jgi:hypothetical protein
MDYMTKAQLNLLDKIYYKEGYTLGRTSLFNVPEGAAECCFSALFGKFGKFGKIRKKGFLV